ncbi:hypothetical protein [uncultured Aliiroseovarius sp.]|uniref:hypothetical protein n=1 Tax=uncultured Aliiroseovarius sp. TaxID=1658783 RepID=UPI002622C6E5|nr:hypothetical protein [uncultured Aliiroseovarius sp.]
MGGAGGLGGLLSILIVASIPVFLLIHIGWWIGKNRASRTLTLRGALLAALFLLFIASAIYPAIPFFGSLDDGREFSFEFVRFKRIISFCFATAGLSALISLALGLTASEPEAESGKKDSQEDAVL